MVMSRYGKTAGVAALVTLALATTATGAEMNAGAFVRDYEQAQAAQKPSYEAAALNVHIGLGWMNSYLQSANPEAQVFCQPAGTTLTGPQAMDALRRFVGAHSEAASEPYGMVLLFALKDMWPCSPAQATK